MSDAYCKEQVYEPNMWRSHRCLRKATTTAGYCKQHDPQLKAARRAARKPTVFERSSNARKRILEICEIMKNQSPELIQEIARLVWEIR